jgi:hypothetical protein
MQSDTLIAALRRVEIRAFAIALTRITERRFFTLFAQFPIVRIVPLAMSLFAPNTRILPAMTLNEHADAILRAAFPSMNAAIITFSAKQPTVLAALQALYAEAFDAGARAGIAAEDARIQEWLQAEYESSEGLPPNSRHMLSVVRRCIRDNDHGAIDPTTLEGRMP